MELNLATGSTIGRPTFCYGYIVLNKNNLIKYALSNVKEFFYGCF